MYNYTRALIGAVAEVVNTLPNKISVRGHTDAHPFASGATYTNWELSADRANSSRRELLSDDVKEDRISDVMGKAARDPLLPDDPFNAQNRRISIILLRQSLDDALSTGTLEQALPEEMKTDEIGNDGKKTEDKPKTNEDAAQKAEEESKKILSTSPGASGGSGDDVDGRGGSGSGGDVDKGFNKTKPNIFFP